MFASFYAYTDPIISFTVPEKEMIERAFTYRHAPKKTKLAKEGSVASELFFIQKGLVRLFYLKDGKEITGFIFREHLFASSYESFLTRQPGVQTLETLEDCDLLVIKRHTLDELYESVPKMHILARKVAEQRFVNAQQMLSSFIIDSPEERYRKFTAQHGDLLLRVPHHMIASYLGITPVSMSRIRNRMAR